MPSKINSTSVKRAACRIYQLEADPVQSVTLYEGEIMEGAQAAFDAAEKIPAFAGAFRADFKAGGSCYARRFAAGGLMLELVAIVY